VELYLHFSNTPSWRGAQLGVAQGLVWFCLRTTLLRGLDESLWMFVESFDKFRKSWPT